MDKLPNTKFKYMMTRGDVTSSASSSYQRKKRGTADVPKKCEEKIDLSKVKNPLHEGPVSANTRCAELPLYDEEHISPWLKGNSFIRSYYRCGYTTKQCLQSVFAIHNETGNIWTHIIGVLVVFFMGFHIFIEMQLTRSSDYYVFLLFELCTFIMLGGSSVYHTLSAHHCESVHNTALALDYFGITAMIIGSFYPPVFYIFSCSQEIRLFYLTTVTALGVLGILGPFFEFYNSNNFYWPRLLLYSALSTLGVMPAFHMFYGLPVNEMTTPLYNGMFVVFSFYAVGMIIFIFKIPERWFPGHFDLFLNSHQLWHIFVLLATVNHYFFCLGAFQWWRVTGGAGGGCG